MRTYFVFVFSTLLLFQVFQSCTKDKTLETNLSSCDSIPITYTVDIHPNLVHFSCISCHGGNSPKLESYEQVVESAKNGNLYCTINWNSCIRMPQGGSKIPDSILKKFDIWKCKNYPK